MKQNLKRYLRIGAHKCFFVSDFRMTKFPRSWKSPSPAVRKAPQSQKFRPRLFELGCKQAGQNSAPEGLFLTNSVFDKCF